MIDYEGRLTSLRSKLGEQELDGLLVTNLTNVRYLTGFSGTNGQVFVGTDRSVFLSDPRYEARARSLVKATEIAIYPSRLADRLKPIVEERKAGRIGIEAKTMTLADRDDLQNRLGAVALVPTSGVVESMRRRKQPEEVELLRAAIALGDRAFEWILDRLVPGATEREIALGLEMKMREWGAEEVSFPPIVGSGPLSAHIHHTPTERELQKGDLVLLDLGCRLDGYCSDLTRTVVLGASSDEQRDVYELVLQAQAAGIEAARPGRACTEVDRAARTVIEEGGRGEHFGHGLGHGVGLDIHEDPRLNRISEESLVAGDVVTVEPGVYLQGSGGVRIEDCVLVTEDGCEVLGSAPKAELIEL